MFVLRIAPGAYALAVILCDASSIAAKALKPQFTGIYVLDDLPAHCVRPRTANLDAAYAERLGMP